MSTLGEIIALLETHLPAQRVRHGFTNPHSYRGTYSDLAFEPCGETTVGEMLAVARGAQGSTFEGWSGGTFTMRPTTSVYLAKRGEVGDELSVRLLCYMLGDRPSGARVPPTVGDWKILSEKPSRWDDTAGRWVTGATWGSASVDLAVDGMGYLSVYVDEYTLAVPLAVVLTLLTVAMSRAGASPRVY